MLLQLGLMITIFINMLAKKKEVSNIGLFESNHHWIIKVFQFSSFKSIFIYLIMSREQEKVFKCFARGKILINKHFESSQKLRKDDIGILENFIGNMLSNYILWFWLSTCTFYLCTVVLCCYTLCFAVKLCVMILVVNLNIVLLYYAVYWCTQNVYIWNTVWNSVFI